MINLARLDQFSLSYVSVSYGNNTLAILKFLRRRGANFDETSNNPRNVFRYRTILQNAIRLESVSIVNYLITNGANLEMKSSPYSTLNRTVVWYCSGFSYALERRVSSDFF